MQDETEKRVAIVRIVASVILADGIITDTEHELLDKLCEKFGLTSEQRQAATAHLNVGEPADDATLSLIEPDAKMDALRAAATAMVVDDDPSSLEREMLVRLAERLGFDEKILDQEIRLAKEGQLF